MLLFVLLFIGSAFACDCHYENDLRRTVLGKVATIESCKGLILESLYHEYKISKQCSNNVEIQWSCGKEKNKKVFECNTFETMLDAESTFTATKLAMDVLNQNLNVKLADINCKSNKSTKDVSQTVAFSVNSHEELHKVLSQVDPDIPGHIFDSIDDYSVTISGVNDNNIVREVFSNKNTSNDLANTYGYNYIIQKRPDGKGYLFELSWNSQLITSYTNPYHPDYSKDEYNVTHVSQYFVEENIGKLLIKKIKEGDKVFWSAGGGIHELNKDNINRSVLFSSGAQQKAFHEFLNKQIQKSGGYNYVKIYDNVPQEGSELAAFIEGNVGKRLTINPLSGEKIRTYVELDAGARATGIKDASFVTAQGSVNMDASIWKKTAARLSAGNRTTIYVTGETSNERFYDVLVGSRKVQVGYRYSENDRKLASYQNPLPTDYAGRDTDIPDKHNTHMILLKVSW